MIFLLIKGVLISLAFAYGWIVLLGILFRLFNISEFYRMILAGLSILPGVVLFAVLLNIFG